MTSRYDDLATQWIACDVLKWSLSEPADRRFLLVTGLFCVIASVALSLWAIYTDPIINNDGVAYVRQSGLLADGQWSIAFADWKWPFYPFLMMLVSAVLPLPYDVIPGVTFKAAGHLINTVCISLVVVLFVAVTRALGGQSRRLTILAAIVALAHPAFNEYRSFLIRDPGFLAAYLAALYCLLLCRTHSSWRPRIAVLVLLLIASLFRIEGVLFLLMSPVLFVLLRGDGVKRNWSIMILATVALLGGGLVMAWWILVPDGTLSFSSVLNQPLKVILTTWEQISTALSAKVHLLRETFLSRYSADDVYVLFGLIVVAIVGSAVLSELTVPFAVLAVYGYTSRLCFADRGHRQIWLALLAINLLILLGFVLFRGELLAPRYLLTMSVTALLAVPFVLERLLRRIRWNDVKGWRLVLSVIVLLWVAGESINGINNPTRKLHLRDAGLWLQPYTGETGSLVTNDRRILYYAGRWSDRTHVELKLAQLLQGLDQERWSTPRFTAIRLKDGQQAAGVIDAIGHEPIERFNNNRGDRVLIFAMRR